MAKPRCPGAEKIGVPFTLSTMSICSIGWRRTPRTVLVPAVRDEDREVINRLIDRAKAVWRAEIADTGLQVLGQRHKDLRNDLSAPPA
jgi:L-lactate dehydrogenase (cytochrome)